MAISQSDRVAWWAHRQGLTGELAGATPAGVLTRAGWARSVGGVTPYLAFFARSGIRRADADAALLALDVHELPSTRGCAYVIPRDEYSVALTLGHGFAGTELKIAAKISDYSEADAAKLDCQILEILAGGPADPSELRQVLGVSVRAFGPEGKKRGLISSLPISLGRLQAAGKIRRIPTDGRLDTQRYKYAAWPDGPLAHDSITADEATAAIADWYFGWIGSATPEEFGWFTAWNKSKIKKILEGKDFVETGDGRLATPSAAAELAEYKAPKNPDVRLIGSLDSLVLLRRNHLDLIDPQDLTSQPGQLMRSGHGTGLTDLPYHAVTDRGRIIGYWDFDHAAREIIAVPLNPLPPAVAKSWDKAVAETQSYIVDDLDDARMMSLDSPKSREKRLAPLRNLLN